MQEIRRYELDHIKSNMYIFLDGNEALIVDPNVSEEAFLLLREREIRKATILLTHEHFDHTVGINPLKSMMTTEVICQEECAKSIAIAKKNRPLSLLMMKEEGASDQIRKFYDSFPLYTYCVDRVFELHCDFKWRSHSISMIATPGHSKGSCCIELDSVYVFTGDSLIPDVPVITRYPGGSMDEYRKRALPYLNKMKEEVFIMPGHGLPCKRGALKYKKDCFRRLEGALLESSTPFH